MLEILKEYGFTLLQLALEALLPVLVVYLIGLVKAWAQVQLAKLAPDKMIILEEAARIAVLAAEQMNLSGQIEAKKDWAVEFAQNYLLENGVPLDLATIEAAIEAAVMDEFNRNR